MTTRGGRGTRERLESSPLRLRPSIRARLKGAADNRRTTVQAVTREALVAGLPVTARRNDSDDDKTTARDGLLRAGSREIKIRLGDELLRALEARAVVDGVSRAATVRSALVAGLDSTDKNSRNDSAGVPSLEQLAPYIIGALSLLAWLGGTAPEERDALTEDDLREHALDQGLDVWADLRNTPRPDTAVGA